MRVGIVLVGIALLAGLTGCRTWASTKENKLTITAPDKVERKGEFTFTVTATDHYGDPADVAYQWIVLWVGANGSVHNGYSGIPEKETVKGGKGTAMLKILGYGPHEKWGEIANHTFEVE